MGGYTWALDDDLFIVWRDEYERQNETGDETDVETLQSESDCLRGD